MATEPHSEGESDPVELQGEVFRRHPELQVPTAVDCATCSRRSNRHAACKWCHLLVMFGHRKILQRCLSTVDCQPSWISSLVNSCICLVNVYVVVLHYKVSNK